MVERYSFFDPVEIAPDVFDREYNAQEFTEYFEALVTTGLMKGAGKELVVGTSGSNMVTTIDKGIAFLEGRQYINTDLLAHTHDTESLGKNRIDRIVIRMDLNTDARHVKSFVKKGVASANPVAPALTQTVNVYEISLAQVKVIGGQTFINKTDVVDERGKDVICPYAGSNIFPNFDDAALADLIANQLTDGPYAKIPADQDFNKILKSGFYSVDMSALNSPQIILEDFKWVLQVISSKPWSAAFTNDPIYQIVYSHLDSRVFRRFRRGNGSWGPWVRLDVQFNNTLTSITTDEAATPNAVKMVNDKLIGSSIKIGFNSSADASGIGIGSNAFARGSGSIALGAGVTSTESASVAIGYGALSTNPLTGVLGGSSGTPTTYIWEVPGSFSVSGTKQFEMPHPHPDKKATHVIRHGAVESPSAGDTLYRYFVDVRGDIAEVKMVGTVDVIVLPTHSRSEGSVSLSIPLPDYWIHLNTDDQVFVNPDRHFSNGYGFVDRDNESLELTFQETRKYNVALFGTRNDDHESVQTWYVRGVEREVGESWTGETYSFEIDEITEIQEITQGGI